MSHFSTLVQSLFSPSTMNRAYVFLCALLYCALHNNNYKINVIICHVRWRGSHDTPPTISDLMIINGVRL